MLGGAQEEAVAEQTIPEAKITRKEADRLGITMQELRERHATPAPQVEYVPGAYERSLARFLAKCIEEAQFAEAWHMLPDNLPINKQPWWKVRTWLRWSSGCADGMRRGW